MIYYEIKHGLYIVGCRGLMQLGSGILGFPSQDPLRFETCKSCDRGLWEHTQYSPQYNDKGGRIKKCIQLCRVLDQHLRIRKK